MLLVALLTALISINGAVAALLPVVVVMAIRVGRSPSQLLMPLVFAAHSGSLLALTGTPVNVLVAEAAADAGLAPFGFFEFAIVGVPLLLGTIAIIVLFGQRLLPERSGRTMPADLSTHARTLVEQYRLDDGMFQLRVRPRSPYVGSPPAAVDLAEYAGLTLVAILAGDGGPLRRPALAEGDILIVRGDAATVGGLASDKLLAFRSEDAPADAADTLFNRSSGLAEVVIPPRSGMIGQPVFPGMVTRQRRSRHSGRAAQGRKSGPRRNRAGRRRHPAASGDLEGARRAPRRSRRAGRRTRRSWSVARRFRWERARSRRSSCCSSWCCCSRPAWCRPSSPGWSPPARWSCCGVLTVEQAYRAVNWTTVILVGAMMPLSTAMETTGAANLMAATLVHLVGDAGPYALLAGLFLLSAILGQLISNTATALIMIPIAMAAASEIGVSPRPVLMSVAVASAAAFLTPVATPVNLMVMGPGGYRFGDYWKLGLPLLLLFFVVATFLVPVFWRF